MGRRLVRGLALLSTFATVALLGYVRYGPLDPPETRSTLPGSVVVDAHGAVVARNTADGLRIPLSLDRVAPRMLQATVAAEDRRFFQHPGIDAQALARAALNYGREPSGASTITQQLARRLYLAGTTEPLAVRKAHESLIAGQLEAARSKTQLLELYLNNIYYGRGAYGVEAAARVYFGVGAANLDLAHAAYLAGLPQRPSTYETAEDQGAALARQRYVLWRMADDGWINKDEAAEAARTPVEVLRAAPATLAPHFIAFARAEIARVRPDLAARDGIVIETTLDAGLQREAERLIRLRLAEFRDRNVTNAAVVAIEPGTGRILAFVGSATDGDPKHSGDIDMTLAPRQPGSALKPFLYAAAFERGFTPATPLLDVATSFATQHGPYAPLDFDRSYHGVVPLRVALASSLNIPAVRTLDRIGLDAMLDMAHRFGLRTLDKVESYGLGLTLGGGEVRLLDLANAYAALGADGRIAEPFAVTRVRDGAGRVLYERTSAPPRRILSAEHAYQLADILSDPDARIPGFGGVTPFELPFAAAVKSGTSTGFRDDWTLGFTPNVAVGVWVGNADGSPMLSVAGVDAAGPIWRDVMSAAALDRRMSEFARPSGLVDVTVCAPTGLLPGPDCPSPVREIFVAGTAPTEVERYYARDADGRITVDPPTEARDWARAAGLPLRSDALTLARDSLRVVAPVPGSIVYPAPELGADQLVIRAAAAAGIGRVAFAVDGVVIGDAPGADPWVIWRLVPGPHALRVSARLGDGSIATATSTFEVKR